MHTNHSTSALNLLKKRENIDDLGHLKNATVQSRRRPISTMDREDLTNPKDGRGPLRKKDDQSNR